MNLTEAQANALLEIGGAMEAHEYIPQRILNDLMSYDFVFFNENGAIEFTPAGKELYDELAAQAEHPAPPRSTSDE